MSEISLESPQKLIPRLARRGEKGETSASPGAKHPPKRSDTVASILLCSGEECIVDEDDFMRLAQYKWTPAGQGYAETRVGGQRVRMHYLVLGVEPRKGYEIHHRNGDKRDNRKSNLQILSSSAHKKHHIKQKKDEYTRSFHAWCEANKIKNRNSSLAHQAYKDSTL